jgi:hypothetical protein
MKHKLTCLLLVSLAVLLVAQWAFARNPIRNAFFNVYTAAQNTQLDDLPSNAGHCGVCHYDFDGGGPRNPYGLAVEVARNSGLYAGDEEAIMSIENVDSDGDGKLNVTEITSVLFSNTPTFPGLTANDSALVLNVTWSDVAPYVEPTGATDNTPPTVTLLTPNGGGAYDPHTTQNVTWTATDASGIDHVEFYMSDDNGSTWEHIGKNEPNDATFDWFVPNLPGSQTLIRVEAYDNAGNDASDDSDAPFTINAYTGGVVPTTLRDMKLPGTQPFVITPLEDPDVNCVTCHGNYDTNVEPWSNWKGSMMAQAMRDPIFTACMEVAEHDAPSVGDLCLRCHTPGGWMEGRSTDTSGGMVTAKDRQGIQCDFCHRLVDFNSLAAEDQDIINELDELPAQYGNGQFVSDPLSTKRGPYSDAVASHSTIYSEFHKSANLCGTCHDVSNPVFNHDGGPVYSPNAFDTEHGDGDLRNMFPVERTFSEWSVSAYADGGVYQPQFAGDKPDGMVSTCQDCHMRDITGVGCSEPGAPTRTDLPHHDLTGGNHFIPDMLPLIYPSEVDTTRLQAGKQRAIDMLKLAASMALAKGQDGGSPTVTVTVTNETGHKLPSGYPEGRRIWLNVKGYDAEGGNLVYESGAYDFGTAVLTHDEDAKIYEIQPGISTRLSPVVGLPVGKSFHFVLNDTVFSDNRIPPRGFTNAAFEAVQSPPVAHAYADSQYWDETTYTLPANTKFVEATLYYQGVSKEYAEFLRDANPNPAPNAGTVFYDAYAASGMAAPVAMQHDTISVQVEPTGIDDGPLAITALDQNYPNPFNPMTTIRYSLENRQHVSIRVYNVRGELVRTLVDEERPAGYQKINWYGQNQNDERVASGIYFIKMTTARNHLVKKAVLLK